jgi:hypothetical protein
MHTRKRKEVENAVELEVTKVPDRVLVEPEKLLKISLTVFYGAKLNAGSFYMQLV